ncbi:MULTISPECIES: MlaE family lipid ABC transporter permease subunit [Rhodomicrobium]|uniref:ABC transporter permease n=1 Tax=Rhodomicrobium TaxID=1068 RepID=UPI000B4AB696|nr:MULTISPECIES: MlaE family lipid ABC transporter permease subunit [Rhodomicrobium]
MASAPALNSTVSGERLLLAASGSWTATYAGQLESLVDNQAAAAAKLHGMSIDMTGVREFDTFGAWLLERLVRAWKGNERSVEITGLPEHYRGLLDEVHQANRGDTDARRTSAGILRWLNGIGRSFEGALRGTLPFVNMFGAVGEALVRVVARPKNFRITSAVHHLDRVGWQAVPIILLITFLIGCIIAQQGFFHFRQFGADIYVVDMVGILVLREIGVLIVAIMVAGRSGSSYTAELGSMKMREEVDALRTMGFDPIEVLVLPRILALLIALPILAFLGSMAALFGGGLVAFLYGGMAPEIYIERLREAISITHFEVGLIKAPFMALVIGFVACTEGLRVQGSAESLGLKTTSSVVKSIFMVIVLDGLFAIFFASIGM